jgi:hypothetical protein
MIAVAVFGATVIIAAMIIAAVLVAAGLVATVMGARGSRGDPLADRIPGLIFRERRAGGQQGGDGENQGHWAFHLTLLGGSPSIRYGASIFPPS